MCICVINFFFRVNILVYPIERRKEDVDGECTIYLPETMIINKIIDVSDAIDEATGKYIMAHIKKSTCPWLK